MALVSSRLPEADLVTDHVSIAEQTELSSLPILSFMWNRLYPYHTPVALRRGRYSPGCFPHDLDYLVELHEYFVLPDPYHDPAQGFELEGEPAVSLCVRGEFL